MLKVECESCKAPYQVDERRVPPTGLKMRCPKCGHTFKVTNPNAPAAAAPAGPTGGASPPRPAPPAAAAPKPAPPSAPKQGPISGRRAPTMTGLGWNQAGGAPIPGLPDIGDDPLGELPAAKIGPVPPKFGGPAAPGGGVPQTRPPQFGGDAFVNPGGGGGDFGALDDLPIPAGDAGLPAFAGNAGLPAFAGKRPGAGTFGQPHMARPPAAIPDPGDFDFDDVPAAHNPPSGFGALDDLPAPAADLPATRGQAPAFGFGGAPKAPAAPAPFGSLDLPAVAGPGAGADLPAMRGPGADLPAPRQPSGNFDLPATRGPGADLPIPRSPSFPSFGQLGGDDGGFGEINLPAVGSAALPAVHGNRDLPSPLDNSKMMPARSRDFSPFDDLPRAQPNDYQLPVVQSALPALQQSLPAVQGSLPAIQSSLPSVQGSLPALQGSLPALQGSLPALQNSLPASLDAFPSPANALPSPKNFDSFGEFELPGAGGGGGSIPPGLGGSGYDDDPRGGGGVGFGEVDLGGGMMDDEPVIGTEEPLHSGHVGTAGIGSEVALPSDGGFDKSRRRAATVVIRRGRSKAPKIIAGVAAVLVVVGAALQATSVGAFGYKMIGDSLNAKSYDQLLVSAGNAARRRTGMDTWSEFRGAVDDLAAAHASTPRARGLTAYAAAVAYEEELRYGQDGQADAHAKGWLAEVPTGSSGAAVDLAHAAGDAVGGDLAKARTELDAASQKNPQDPVQQDIALTRGEVELAAKQYVAAIAAFKKANDLAPSARAQFGIARGALASGDTKTARAAANAALAFNKQHAGALLLRARLEWREDHADDAALADLAAVLDGPGASAASPMELSDAHALRGWIQLSREKSADARTQFTEAINLNARNVLALVGQGEVLLGDQRATEAKARFDTALGADPTDVDAIVGDAKAKIALEDLQSAKSDLIKAQTANGKAWKIPHTLGKVEEALGNRKGAEVDYQAAIKLVDTKDPHALLPYISLAEVQALEGKADDATATLEDAKSKLPDSDLMQRAFGDVAAAQGKFDDAVARYQAALSKDPNDLETQFRLGVAYRKMGRADDAEKAFNVIADKDKEYPGLALERGQVYEETGHMDQALAMFQGALAKAPNDPDTMLRVGAAYISIGKWQDGMPMVKKVLDARQNSAEANFYYGRGYLLQGKVEAAQAVRYLQKAVDLDPNRAEYHLYIAWQANDADPPALNIVDKEVTRALELDPTLADAYWQRGVLERKRTRIDDAMKDLRHALELKPSRFEAHATLAECFEEKNDDNSAIGEWQKAIAGNDQNAYWRYRLGKLRSVHGQGGASLDDLNFAVEQGEAASPSPGWLYDAEFLDAEALRARGQAKAAIDHYNAFIKIAPPGSPDVAPAKRALQLLGAPYVQQ